MRQSLPWMLALALVACDRSAEREQTAPEPPPAPEAKTAASAAPESSARVEPAPEASAAPTASATADEPKPAPAQTATAATAKTSAVEAASAKPVASEKSAPAAPEKKVTTAVGSGAAGEGFRLSIQAPTPVAAGKSSAAVVVLSAVAPYKCNEKYPYKLVLDPPSGGVSYPQPTVRGMAVGKERSSMSVPFSATQPGPATIAGQLHFSVCTDDKCLIEKRRVAVTVQVD